MSFKPKNVKICTKNFDHNCCEIYCVLTMHTIKLSRKKMHESPCPIYEQEFGSL